MRSVGRQPLSLFSALFTISVACSYFLIWAGAFLKIGEFTQHITPLLIARLLIYAVIMVAGMMAVQRLAFKKGVSLMKIILTVIIAPFIIFMIMAMLDTVMLSLFEKQSLGNYIAQRISIYMTRFYVPGVSAALITGLLYHLSEQARNRDNISAQFM